MVGPVELTRSSVFQDCMHNREIRRRLAAGRKLKMCWPIWVVQRSKRNRFYPVEDLGTKTVGGHKVIPRPVVCIEVPENQSIRGRGE